jgi:hypothetical protein
MRNDSLPVIDSLDELTRLVEHKSDVYLRYSHGPERDADDAASCDYESDVMMPGVSVTPVAPEAWWPRPARDWIARRIRQYAHLSESGRYAWVLTGDVVGHGPDHEPLVKPFQPIARLSQKVLDEAETCYRDRFNVGQDSTSD